jgi:hypothetical protein
LESQEVISRERIAIDDPVEIMHNPRFYGDIYTESGLNSKAAVAQVPLE